MSKQNPATLLMDCIKNGLAWTELHGYHWFKSTFLPCIKSLEALSCSPKNSIILSESYHLLGDLYFILDAPIACLKAYKKALRLNNKDTKLFQDISDVLFMLGRYKESRKYEIQSFHLKKDVHKKTLHRSIDIIQDIPHRLPIFRSRDPLWLAHERLAAHHTRSALRLVEIKRGIRARRIRAMAFGAMEDIDAVMHEWTCIAKTYNMIDLHVYDWFYLPSIIWETPKFWKIILEITPRLSSLCLFSPSSESQGPPELMTFSKKRSWHKIHRYAIEYHLARTTSDINKLRRLCKLFPKWRDCKITLQYLDRTGKPPTRDDLLRLMRK